MGIRAPAVMSLCKQWVARERISSKNRLLLVSSESWGTVVCLGWGGKKKKRGKRRKEGWRELFWLLSLPKDPSSTCFSFWKKLKIPNFKKYFLVFAIGYFDLKVSYSNLSNQKKMLLGCQCSQYCHILFSNHLQGRVKIEV